MFLDGHSSLRGWRRSREWYPCQVIFSVFRARVELLVSSARESIYTHTHHRYTKRGTVQSLIDDYRKKERELVCIILLFISVVCLLISLADTMLSVQVCQRKETSHNRWFMFIEVNLITLKVTEKKKIWYRFWKVFLPVLSKSSTLKENKKNGMK